MDFYELAKSRYSCRSFEDKKVEKDLILKILECGRIAPSAKNLQPTKVMVVTTDENIEKLKTGTKCTFGAKQVFIVMYDKNISWKRANDNMDEGILDASINATHLMLAIESFGLGTTWVGMFDKDIIKEQFNISDNYEIVCLLPFGYKSVEAKPIEMHFNRKEMNEYAIFDKE